MAVNNLITLPEYAKGFAKEDIRRTVIEMFTQKSDVLEVLPFESMRGAKYTGYREARCPCSSSAASTRRPRPATASSRRSMRRPTSSTTTSTSTARSRTATVRSAAITRSAWASPPRARLWVDTFIKGDQSTNPRIFNGIQLRSNLFGRKFHNSAGAGGAALSLINLDQMLNNLSKKSGTSYLFVPFNSLPLWIQAARTQTLTGFVMQTWDEIGMPKLSYAGYKHPVRLSEGRPAAGAAVQRGRHRRRLGASPPRCTA
jgi:hypothetical protein